MGNRASNKISQKTQRVKEKQRTKNQKRGRRRNRGHRKTADRDTKTHMSHSAAPAPRKMASCSAIVASRNIADTGINA